MTKPFDDLLPLPMDSRAEPFMNLYHDAIHELVCFGTHIVVWNLDQGKDRAEERNEIALVPTLLFRHILELLDAISVQVKVGVIVPCKIQLRATLEAYLSLDYMLDKDRDRRAACFLLIDHYRNLNFYKRLTYNTPESKKLAGDLKDFGLLSNNVSPINDAGQANKNQESLIALPIYAEARKEYLALTKNNTANLDIKWYALFGGPNSIIWLAKRLKKFDLYEFFYKSWSNQTHGTNLSNKVIVKADDGNGAIVQLRNMAEAHEVVTQTIMLALLIFELMAKKVVSEHRKEISEWNLWYRDNYRIRVDQNKMHFK